MNKLLALLLLSNQAMPYDFTEHGKVFITLLTCAEHTIGFDDTEKQQLMNLAFDLSDNAKTKATTEDLSFVSGMTEQQDLLAEKAVAAQSYIYGSASAQVSAYLPKDLCLATKQQAQTLLNQLNVTQ